MSIYQKPPCINDGKPCEKRFIGCHAKCKDFLEWKENRDKKMASIRQNNDVKRKLDDADFSRATKYNRRRAK